MVLPPAIAIALALQVAFCCCSSCDAAFVSRTTTTTPTIRMQPTRAPHLGRQQQRHGRAVPQRAPPAGPPPAAATRLRQRQQPRDEGGHGDGSPSLLRRDDVLASLARAATAAAAAAAIDMVALSPQVTHAEYGVDAKIELPNPYQQLADRSSKQCLVESLGNRECLVYADESSLFLYRGADAQVLLGRIERASAALATVPTLVESKQWSKVTGILTGPMGELIRTMGQVADLSNENGTNNNSAREQIKKVKVDLYAMNDGVGRKDQGMVLRYHAAATNDLVTFIKAL
jgi:hypothetical protein